MSQRRRRLSPPWTLAEGGQGSNASEGIRAQREWAVGWHGLSRAGTGGCYTLTQEPHLQSRKAARQTRAGRSSDRRVIGAKGSHTQRPDPHPAMRARRVAIGQTRLQGRAAAGGTIPPLNTHEQLFGVRTCGEGLGLHGRLEAGLLITPLGHVASKAHYPLGGRTVAILDRAESN